MKNERLSKISKSTMVLVGLAMVGAGFGAAVLVSADTTTPTTAAATAHAGMQAHRGDPGIMGKVTAINGTTLTVTSTSPKNSTTTTYTVDASAAKVMKSPTQTATTGTTAASVAPTAATVSDIVVGDTIHVRGTISGTTVKATDIMDGVMWGGPRGGGGGPGGHGTNGTITAINGSTITVTGKNGVIYTVNASSAKLEKVSTISVSDLAVGDTIQANGTLSGTSVTATHILDGALGGR
jgi:hypothetical protein